MELEDIGEDMSEVELSGEEDSGDLADRIRENTGRLFRKFWFFFPSRKKSEK